MGESQGLSRVSIFTTFKMTRNRSFLGLSSKFFSYRINAGAGRHIFIFYGILFTDLLLFVDLVTDAISRADQFRTHRSDMEVLSQIFGRICDSHHAWE